MSIEQNIERMADALEHLCAVADMIAAREKNALMKVVGAAVVDGGEVVVPAAAVVETAQKKSRAKKAVAEAVVETAAPVQTDDSGDDDAGATNAMTLDDANEKLRALVTKGVSGSAIMDLLGQYDPKGCSLRNIDPIHYGEIVSRAEAL